MSFIDSWVSDGHWLAIQTTAFVLTFHFSAIKTHHGQRGTAARWLRFPQVSCKGPLSSLSLCVLHSSDIYRLTATFHHPSSLPHSSTSTFFCPQTSTSRRPSWAPGVGMLMSKQVTIMTRDLHRLTQNSSSSVACAKASRYSGDSLSKFWSTSTVRKGKITVWLHDLSHGTFFKFRCQLQEHLAVTYTLPSTCWGPSLIAPWCLPAPPTTLHALPSVPSLAVAFSPASSVYC